jgi:thiosulfate/3-mercaptopyruvate sulfurtransferase
MEPLFVEVSWLRDRIEEAGLRIIDARSTPHGAPGLVARSGRELYAEGHVPGAIHLDYAGDLHDPATPYAARVAPAWRFAQVMGAAGVGDGATIVVYDDGTTPYAARMVWMLHYYGQRNAHILAGGLPAWQAAGAPLSGVPGSYPPACFSAVPNEALRASRAEVLAVAEGSSDAQLLETQRDASYVLRALDLRGARRLSASELLQDANGGRIAPQAELQRMIAAAGLDPRKRTITSCGSGVSASGAYLALLEAGFTDVAVYDGSWMEWSHDRLPTVPKPGIK